MISARNYSIKYRLLLLKSLNGFLYLQEKERSLALPSLEQQAIEPAVSGVNTWTYVLKNSVMYVPDGKLFFSDKH